MSIYIEFLSSLRQRVIFYGSTSEWNPIVLGVLLGSVLCPLIFIIYTIEIFRAGGKQIMCLSRWFNSAGSCFQSCNRPAVASSFTRDFSRNKEWCNRWFMIIILIKNALIVNAQPRLWTLSITTWFPFRASQRICIVKLERDFLWHCCVPSLLLCICAHIAARGVVTLKSNHGWRPISSASKFRKN